MKIYIYGASGHGSVVADIARLVGYRAIFIDDGDNIHPPFESIKFNIETPIALGVGDNRVREILFNRAVDAGFSVVPLIHKSAVIGSGVRLEQVAVVMGKWWVYKPGGSYHWGNGWSLLNRPRSGLILEPLGLTQLRLRKQEFLG